MKKTFAVSAIALSMFVSATAVAATAEDETRLRGVIDDAVALYRDSQIPMAITKAWEGVTVATMTFGATDARTVNAKQILATIQAPQVARKGAPDMGTGEGD